MTALAAPIAYTYMFFGFRAYDDEGYELLTIGDYLSGKPVVTPFMQLYGPFYYEVWGGVYRALGLVPGHDSGRLLTLAVWLMAGVLGGIAVHRLTRSLVLAIAAQVVTLSVLTVLSSEPMTTYGLISLLLLGIVVAATFHSAHPRASAAAIGASVAALCLIKINIGAFAGVAVALAWVGSLPPRWKRFSWPAATALAAALPFALMAPRLSSEWALDYAVVVSLSAIAIGVASASTSRRREPPASVRWLVSGGLVTLALCVSIVIAGGTHLQDLWTGLVLAPIRFPAVSVVPMPTSMGLDLWAALCLAGAIASSRRMRRLQPGPAGLVSVWAGFLTWLFVLRQPSPFFLLALPLVWLAVRSPESEGQDPAGSYSRLIVAAVAVIGALQAYPVAGSQLGLSALMLVPAGALMLADGIRDLRRAGTHHALPDTLARWTRPAVLSVSLVTFAVFGLVSALEYSSGVPLDLPGASALRVPPSQAVELRELVTAINRDCSSFVTYPGMDSLYLWTGQAPPTDIRWGQWFLNLDDAQQASIVEQLQAKPRVCVVKNQQVIDFWTRDVQLTRRPLINYIEQSFVPDGTYGDYQLLVRA